MYIKVPLYQYFNSFVKIHKVIQYNTMPVPKLAWKELTNDEKEWKAKLFPEKLEDEVVRYDNGFLVRRKFVNQMENFQNFVLRDDDIFIMSHPKTGSTWTQELVWMMVNDLDVEMSKNTKRVEKSPNIGKLRNENYGPEFFERMEGRRVIKTHLSFDFLPSNLSERCKIIYVARNPKDTVVSFYHHLKRKSDFLGNFKEFTKYFKEELLHHSYWPNLMSGWVRRHNIKNVKILWYEDMKADIKATIDDISEFIGQPLTEEQKDILQDHVKFDNMKKNINAYSNTSYNTTNPELHFMRKGIVGDWANYFDEQTNKEYNEWILEKIKGSGLENLDIFKQILTELDLDCNKDKP